MHITFAALSHAGKVRSNNEDNLYAGGVSLTPETREKSFLLCGEKDAPDVFAICDGMGGQESGELASLLAVQTLDTFAPRMREATSEQLDALAQQCVVEANAAICTEMRNRNARMGTTFAMLTVRDQSVHAYSIGDSRVYVFANRRLRQLSEDHTLVATKMKMGLLTEGQARKDHDWHRLTAHLGVFADELSVSADVLLPVAVMGSMRFLLCSDGLTDMVWDDRIEAILRESKTAEQAAVALFDEAMQNGGRDNTSIIVIDVQKTETPPAPTKPISSRPRAGTLAAIFMGAFALLFVLFALLYFFAPWPAREAPEATSAPVETFFVEPTEPNFTDVPVMTDTESQNTPTIPIIPYIPATAIPAE
ncbi:MAG: protein phosphatase 2C domain-containing protein [Clostridiales bacterium]|nr:protein phosphatase 2C domain-containing protein [Clostridiales bacterium]